MSKVILVNKENKIKESYFHHLDLITTTNYLGKEIKLEKETYDAFLRLQKFLLEQGIEIEIEDGFRSVLEQQKIEEEFLNQYGEEYTKKMVASPYTSEHHTGLAIDLVLKKEKEYMVENKDLLSQEEIWKKIHPVLKDYGFIVRYPKKKEQITGYSYEPWHIRYVGVVPATIIFDYHLTLEEYVTDFGGVLVVNKDTGMTSRDVVNKVSKILGIKKIGHTGTLDPLASGVLVLTIGYATKLGKLLTSYEKEYEAGVEVGYLTDTLDKTGKIVKEKKVEKRIDYRTLLKSYEKTYFQEVPIYSAVKVNGKKLYEYARNHESVVLPKKEVTIKSISLLEERNDSFQFRCFVSKGTYIRSLIRDMGDSCSEYFTMSSLIRTKQGNFPISMAYSLKDIENNHFDILSVEEALPNIPVVIVDSDILKKVRNGVKLENNLKIEDKVIFKDKNNQLLVIYQKEKNILKIEKMLYNKCN